MARQFQAPAHVGAAIDPGDLFLVDRSGTESARRATQLQVVNGLLSQAYDPGLTFPPGSLGAMLVGSAGGTVGTIDSFISVPGPLVETGLTITNPVLNWGITGAVNSQSLAGP